MRPIVRRLVTSLVSLLLAAPLMAQTATTASMSGRVTDSQGSVVPGATVTLTDRSTTQASVTISDPQGRYSFFNLRPGVYDLAATLAGFKPAAVAGLAIEATRAVVQDVGLEVGGLTDIVNRVATYNVPTKGRAVSVGLVGVITSNLTNEFRVGYVKDDRGAIPIDPAPQVPGLNIAIDLSGLAEPIDVGTQNARKQLFPLTTYQIINNLTWLKGSDPHVHE